MKDEIKFSCLACGQRIVCDASESGRTMLCPSCHANLTVPRQMLEKPSSEPATPEPSVTPPPVTEAVAAASSRTSGLAVASLICSLSSVITCIGWLPGIICGHLAKARIRRDPSLRGQGLATAGLIIGYAIFILGTGLAASEVISWSLGVRHAFHQAKLEMATNKITFTQTQIQSATNKIVFTPAQTPSKPVPQNNPPAPAANSAWTMDVKHAPIPDSPVTGKIHGRDFEFRRAFLRGNFLKFTSTNGAEYVLIRGLGQDIANNNFEVEPDSTGGSPRVEIAWGANGQNNTESFATGYALELKFGPAQKRKVSGRIYLCLPDESKSYLAGDFTIFLPRPKAPQPAAEP